MESKQDLATEERYHNYTSNDIPWYVRLMWLGYWVLVVVYAIRFLFPAIQRDFFNSSRLKLGIRRRG